MPQTGIENAIRELDGEKKRIQEMISMLRGLYGNPGARPRAKRRRLSPEARRRISLAAKKRWAKMRGPKKKSAAAKQ